MKRFSALVGVLAVFALMAPSIASASSTCQAYSPQLCGSVTTTTSATSSSTLPFTGLDVVLLVAGGGTLLGAGFVVRRMSRRLD
jgi:hypothetical protein